MKDNNNYENNNNNFNDINKSQNIYNSGAIDENMENDIINSLNEHNNYYTPESEDEYKSYAAPIKQENFGNYENDYYGNNQDGIKNQNNYDSQNSYENQNNYPFHSNQQYSYLNSDKVTNAMTPTINIDNVKTKKKNNGFFKNLLVFTLVALTAGTAGGGITYKTLDSRGVFDSKVVENQDIVKKTDNDGLATANNMANTAADGSITSVAEKATPSVVEISTSMEYQNNFVGSYVESGAGSGVIISEDGYIVTNNHVINGASSVKVRTHDGKEYDAKLIGVDSQTDLAVIKIEATGLIPAAVADSDDIDVGELAVAIGNPLGTLGGTVTDGIVSAKDRKIEFQDGTVMTLIQTSAAVNPGNSGGGLFNGSGKLIGIVNAKSSGEDVEGLGFAIPSNLMIDVVNDIIELGYVSGRPQIGVELVDIPDARTALYYKVDEIGVYIASTNPENGLKVGDRVMNIDDTEIKTSSDIKEILSTHSAGEILKIKVNRDGVEVMVDVTLQEQKPAETN